MLFLITRNRKNRNKVHKRHVTTHFSYNVSKLVSKKVIFATVILALVSGILPIPFSANYPDQFAGIAVKAEMPAPPSHQAPPLAALGGISSQLKDVISPLPEAPHPRGWTT